MEMEWVMHVTIVSIRQILINWTVTEMGLGMNAMMMLTTMVNVMREIINAQFESISLPEPRSP